jgi:ABC-type Fe3+ transport system permease subunit
VTRRKSLIRGFPALGLALFVICGVVSLFFSADFDGSRIIFHLLSRELRFTVLLTLQFSLLALFCSWIGSWGVVLLTGGKGGGVFRFFSVLPGMAFALFVLLVLRWFEVESPYSMQSVLIAWVLAGILYLSAGISEGIRDLGSRGKEALRTLGAGPVRAFLHHEFRGTLPVQASLLLQQFWFFLTSFSLVMILSGGPPFETIEVAIYSAVRLGQVDYSKALALAFVQSFLLIAVRFALVRVKSRIRRERGISEGYRRSPDAAGRIGTFVVLACCSAILIVLGFRISGWTEFLKPLGLSILLGIVVVFFTLIFSISTYFSGFRALATISTWFSPLLLSLSIWSFSGFTLPPFLNVALIQTLFFSPWFSQVIFPILDREQKAELEAARVLGAGKLRAFLEVEWPRLRGGVRRVLGLVFALSVTEVTSVMLFSRGDFDTLSSYAQNLFSRFRIEEAAFGVMVMILVSAMSLHFAEERA